MDNLKAVTLSEFIESVKELRTSRDVQRRRILRKKIKELRKLYFDICRYNPN